MGPKPWWHRLGRSRLSWFVAGMVAMYGGTFWVWLPAQPAERSTAPASDRFQETTVRPTVEGSAEEGFLGVLLARKAVDVASEMDGLIEELEVRVGDSVLRGQRIGRLDTRRLQHQLEIERAGLRAARAEMQERGLEVEKAEREDERRKQLTGLLSQEEIAAVAFNHQTALAVLEGARARVEEKEARVTQLEADLARSEIVAPFDGVIAARYRDPGALLSSGDLIVRIISSDDLLVRFVVPPEEIDAFRLGSELEIRLSEPALRLQGKVHKVAPELDLAARAIFVEATVQVPELESETLPSGVEVSVALL